MCVKFQCNSCKYAQFILKKKKEIENHMKRTFYIIFPILYSNCLLYRMFIKYVYNVVSQISNVKIIRIYNRPKADNLGDKAVKFKI